jgi:hypothetical protein
VKHEDTRDCQPFWREISAFIAIFHGRTIPKGEWTYVTDRVGGIN